MMSGGKGELAGGAVSDRQDGAEINRIGPKRNSLPGTDTAMPMPSNVDDSQSPGGKTKKRRRPRLKLLRRFVHRVLQQLVPAQEPRSRADRAPKARDVVTDDGCTRSTDLVVEEISSSRRVLDPNSPVPGVAGLANHGNTCFMNAVLQCLNNTDSLAEYFVMDQFRGDLEMRSKRTSGRGEVTKQLAVLMKSLWSCCYTSRVTADLKQLIGRQAPQYRGYAQHDAQEFLLWMLDKVHEDLNRALKKTYKPLKVSRLCRNFAKLGS